ncbi:MAG TPA: 8-amino-7-oxononanoate synthase, partial [Verrucomicrobiae bacterium]|nr:8-amino-7-oxononanoate synthase [Verrucomicrobiae bacterium]
MTSLEQSLAGRLSTIMESGLYRVLRELDSPQGTRILSAGREFINFSSNDYLGLTNHPALKEAAVKAVERFG